MNRYAILTCEFPFQATHHLPGYCDPYDRPHSHSYRLQISLRDPVQEDSRRSDDGMVIAFEDLQRSVERMILQGIYLDVPCRDATNGGLDQNDLNRLTGRRTTAENLVHWIWDGLVAAGVPDDLLYRIRLWVTERWHVEITHAERETDAAARESYHLRDRQSPETHAYC